MYMEKVNWIVLLLMKHIVVMIWDQKTLDRIMGNWVFYEIHLAEYQ